MAWVPREGANFSVLEDEDGDSCSSTPQSPQPASLAQSPNTSFDHVHQSANSYHALRDLDPNNAGLSSSQSKSTNRAADSLVDELRKFHIAGRDETTTEDEERVHEENVDFRTVEQQTDPRVPPITPTPKSKGRGLRARPAIEANTFHAPETIQEEDESIDPAVHISPVSPASIETIKASNGKRLLQETIRSDFSRTQQIRRALDQNFDILVRLTVDELSGKTICYGCTILPRSQRNLDRDTYSVVGRPVEDPRPTISEPIPTSPFTGKAPDNSFSGQQPPKMISRIEDSLEAIDKLEEQLESFNAVTKVKRVVSPEARHPVAAVRSRPMSLIATSPCTSTNKKASSVQPTPAKEKTTYSSSGSSRFSTLNPAKLQVAKRTLLNFELDDKTPALRRISLVRTSSLSEPKVKTMKPLTIPSLELASATIARKLKEQRDACHQKSADKGLKTTASGSSPGLGRVKSTKPPTHPNFDLLSDAIGWRKREDREASPKAKEEEERKKREAKTKPIRSSTTHTYPRETIASRARQQNKATPLNTSRHHVQPETTPSKRLSVTARTPLSNSTASSVSPRGRASVTSSSPTTLTSRAASASTGSISGKRSIVSADDHQHQKMRGKEVYARDNKYSEDRERERRERELNAKAARQEAAERSRQASREWAEKQRQKKLSSVNAKTCSASRHIVTS